MYVNIVASLLMGVKSWTEKQHSPPAELCRASRFGGAMGLLHVERSPLAAANSGGPRLDASTPNKPTAKGCPEILSLGNWAD